MKQNHLIDSWDAFVWILDKDFTEEHEESWKFNLDGIAKISSPGPGWNSKCDIYIRYDIRAFVVFLVIYIAFHFHGNRIF